MDRDDRIRDVLRRHAVLEPRLANPAVLGPAEVRGKVAREHPELAPTAESARRLAAVREQVADARQLVNTADDPEMVALAKAEVDEHDAEHDRLLETFRKQLIPKDPLADRAAVVEIRAGTGGDE